MAFDPSDLVNVIWVALEIVWCVGALRSSPVARRQSIGSRMTHALPLVVCGVMLIPTISAVGPMAWRFTPDTALVGWTGATITAIGLGLSIAARLVLGRNWSVWVTVKKEHRLIRSGPYAVVGHPIYSGILVGLLGTAVVVGEMRGLIAVAFAVIGLP